MDRIVAQNKRFVDSYARERIFLGINVVDKRANGEDNGAVKLIFENDLDNNKIKITF